MNVKGVQGPGYGQNAVSEQHIRGSEAGQGKTTFGQVLQEKAGEPLNFSKHAARRIDERGIHLDNRLISDLEHAVESARKKGAKDVAVIGSQGVFIVNIPNNVVVTTMSPDDMENKIFTNIDSAVLMQAGPKGCLT